MTDRIVLAALVDRLIYGNEQTFSAADARTYANAVAEKRGHWSDVHKNNHRNIQGMEGAPMICAMSAARNTPAAAERWREFAAQVEEPHEPVCPICDIRHFRDKPGAPYCHMAQRFFLWCREQRAVTEAAMNEARTTVLPRYATAQEMIDGMEPEP